MFHQIVQYYTVQIITADLTAVSLLLAALLTAISDGSYEYACPTPAPGLVAAAQDCSWRPRPQRWHIGEWKKYKDLVENSTLRYFVFGAEFALFLTVVFLLLWRRFRKEEQRNRAVEICVAFFGFLLCGVLAGLEIWFSSGLGLQVIKAYSWAGAAAFLVIAGVILLFDMVWSLTKRPAS